MKARSTGSRRQRGISERGQQVEFSPEAVKNRRHDNDDTRIFTKCQTPLPLSLALSLDLYCTDYYKNFHFKYSL